MKILLVDDNEAFVNGLAELLAADGHAVRVCYSGAESLSVAPGFVPELVFLDMGLPDIDGCEVARRLRAEPGLASVRFVSISGCGPGLSPAKSRGDYFFHTLTKPLKIEELEELITRLSLENA